MFKGIDFYSDTLTKPTVPMRKAIAEAEVGDEQKGEDPTTLKLEAKVADLLGFSAAMYFPSATMASEVAIRAMIQPGDELIAAETCHLFVAEAGGPAVHAAAMVKAIRTPTGIFDGEAVRAAFTAARGPHYPISRLLSIENTTNVGGGRPWPLATLDSALDAAKDLGLKTHLDGARFFNAVVALGCPPARLAARFDMATLCLSKGLGCPMGAVLVFDKSHYEKIRRLKQLMGGAMRQSGMMAAAGIYALDHHVRRLEEDHENARRLAEKISALKGIEVEDVPQSNMVYFRWTSSKCSTEEFLDRCEAAGVRFSYAGGNRVRAVTHLNLHRDDIEKAADRMKEVCHSL